jgi:pyruvate/2-oxoacid:ferredoxin oxidoreductase beta subunit
MSTYSHFDVETVFRSLSLSGIILLSNASDFTILYSNNAFYGMTGSDESMVTGKGVSEVFRDKPEILHKMT